MRASIALPPIEEKSDVIDAVYERIVIEGSRFVGLRVTPAALPVQAGSPAARCCYGAPDRIRTCDLRLRRPTLYPLSYRRVMGTPSLSDVPACSGQAEGPSEEGPSSAAGFANRKGIFHERFPVLPLPKPTHGLAISSESLCEQHRKDTREVGFRSMAGH